MGTLTLGCAHNVPNTKPKTVALTWHPQVQPSGVLVGGWRVYRAGSCTPPGQLTASTAPTVTSVAQTKVKSGTYMYWVTALSVKGVESVPSNCQTVIVP